VLRCAQVLGVLLDTRLEAVRWCLRDAAAALQVRPCLWRGVVCCAPRIM
jgi:hypothetical protein